jgi:hypothetical protein
MFGTLLGSHSTTPTGAQRNPTMYRAEEIFASLYTPNIFICGLITIALFQLDTFVKVNPKAHLKVKNNT